MVAISREAQVKAELGEWQKKGTNTSNTNEHSENKNKPNALRNQVPLKANKMGYLNGVL